MTPKVFLIIVSHDNRCSHKIEVVINGNISYEEFNTFLLLYNMLIAFYEIIRHNEYESKKKPCLKLLTSHELPLFSQKASHLPFQVIQRIAVVPTNN